MKNYTIGFGALFLAGFAGMVLGWYANQNTRVYDIYFEKCEECEVVEATDSAGYACDVFDVDDKAPIAGRIKKKARAKAKAK